MENENNQEEKTCKPGGCGKCPPGGPCPCKDAPEDKLSEGGCGGNCACKE